MVLVVLGSAGIVATPTLLFVGAIVAVAGPKDDAGIVFLAALGSLTLGGVGLGLGIPLIRNGARKEVRDPPAAKLWLAPGTLTVTF